MTRFWAAFLCLGAFSSDFPETDQRTPAPMKVRSDTANKVVCDVAQPRVRREFNLTRSVLRKSFSEFIERFVQRFFQRWRGHRNGGLSSCGNRRNGVKPVLKTGCESN